MDCSNTNCNFFDSKMTDNCSKGEPPNVENCAQRSHGNFEIPERNELELLAAVTTEHSARLDLLEGSVIQFFEYEHLPEHLQEISKPICELAEIMILRLPDNKEKEIGLRKLLEAKDCFVRANL
jgi:hypothetical protein